MSLAKPRYAERNFIYDTVFISPTHDTKYWKAVGLTKSTSFEEIYPVKENYKRFDQRDSAFGQQIRKTGRMTHFHSEEYRTKRILENVPGFSLVDYSFKDSAGMYETLPWENITMDKGFYSWSPLGAALKPNGVQRWEGTTEEASRLISKACSFFGAVGVGFCELDKRWVYTHSREGRKIVFENVEEGYVTDERAVIPESHKWVIALLVPMEFEEISYTPTVLEVATYMGYSRMHLLAGHVAEFIRGLGYHAIPAGNDTALSIPIAIQADLDHLGRHGRLITWERGPLVRILKIFTDLPLPQSLPASSKIIDFCKVCMKCAKHCPSNSIPEGARTWVGPSEANNPGTLKWYCDAEACLRHWEKAGAAGSICFKVCNFTKEKGIIHEVVKWFIRNVPKLNKFWVWAEEQLGYGRMSDPKEYWR